MATTFISAVRSVAAVAMIGVLAACTPGYLTPPKPGDYVKILPLPPSGTLRDILVREGRLVGEQDPTTPGDPSVRILHGIPSQAKALFDFLRKGGTPVRSPLGTAFRLPDGSTVVYYENVINQGTFSTVGNVEIFILGSAAPVSQLRFYVPPSSPSIVMRDGGGDM